MATFVRPPLDFDVIKEIWSKYELANGDIIKVKVVLTVVRKTSNAVGLTSPKPNYTFDLQSIVIVLTNERGPPDSKSYSPQELQASITKDDIRYTTITQDWNEYVVDDGARIKLQPIVMKVSKTSKFNAKGEPIYFTEINVTAQIKTPPSSEPTALA